jgi:hypothetical protein
MKLLSGVAVAALLFATPAFAQTTPAAPAVAAECGTFPSAPSAPDGATASNEAMSAANTAFTQWAEAYRGVLACHRAEAEALAARSAAKTGEVNTAVTSFNTTSAAWEVEVTEYNARPNRGTQRSGMGAPRRN